MHMTQIPGKNTPWRAWWAVALVCALCLVAALLLSRPLGVQAAPNASHLQQDVIEPPVQAWLDPAYSRIDVGERITLTVRTSDLDQLCGFQWMLRFNPAVLQVVDTDLGTAGVQIIPAEVFAGKNVVEAGNTANNNTGEIAYGQALFMETYGVDGEAMLGQVVFESVSEGVSALRFGTGSGQSRLICLRYQGGIQTPVEVPSTWLRGRINVGSYVLYLPQVGK